MASKKTAKKSPKLAPPSPRSGVRLPLGNHPGNTGGKPGRSGRKPNWWKEHCADLLEDPQTQAELKAAIQDRSTPGYASLVKTLAEYAEGLPHDPNLGERDELARAVATLLGVT